jgi:MarR family
MGTAQRRCPGTVSPTDRKCLDLLSRGPITAGELGRFTGLTSGAVTGIIDRLVAAAFAERVIDPNDRRRVLVSRKPGSKLDHVLPAIFGPLGDDMTEVASRYSSEQLTAIADFLARTRDVLVENTKRLEQQQLAE